MPWRTVSAAKAGVTTGTPAMAANDVRASPNCRRVIASYERDIADSLEGSDYCGSLIARERGENPLGGERKLLDADASGGGERIRNRRRDPYNAGLTHAFGAKGAARLPLLHNDRFDLERDVESPRYLVIHHGRIGEAAGIPHQLLAQCVAEPLDETALDLSFNRQRVDRLAHVMREPRRQRSDFSRVGINLDLNSLRTEGVHPELR